MCRGRGISPCKRPQTLIDMKLITLTLNPAIDVHCSAESFEACHENLATVTEREAGGKGINISRALTVNNVENLAILAVGDENGAEFCRELDKDGMNYRAITVNGRIYEPSPGRHIAFAK